MESLNICRALSCESRWKILEILSINDYSVDELSEMTKLSSITIRHHLNELERAGLIDKRETTVKLAGRPKHVYTLKEDEVHIAFPARDYKTIQQVIQRSLNTYFKTKADLYDFYVLSAKEFAKEFLGPYYKEEHQEHWDINAINEKLITEIFGKYGGIPEIVETGHETTIFRLHVCPFGDTKALGFDFICNTISRTFLSEIARKTGISGIEIIKTRFTKPNYCEFKIHVK